MKPHFADIIDCCQTSCLFAFDEIERKEVILPSYDVVLNEVELI
jgi:hypothetical protein